ncbi:MAG: Holliday junction resolvase RuvX [Clostridia bacterium]|nr:Holliday junction resolvase RuvX [Clostridia bacterium]
MDITHGKYLGVDYGDVRTGIAECDISGMLASGICTLKEGGMRNTAIRVVKEAEARSCKKIIVGLPKNMDGSEGFRAEAVGAFVRILRELTAIPVELYDERMTTMLAYRFLDGTGTHGKARKGAVDTLSAEIILQNYLDAERRQKNGN